MLKIHTERISNKIQIPLDEWDEIVEKLKRIERITIIENNSNKSKTKKGSFLQIARSLNLEGPSDWSTRFKEYLYERKSVAND